MNRSAFPAALFESLEPRLMLDAAPEMAFAYQLPASPVDETYRVTVAVAPADDPDWIVSTFIAGETRTVTTENGGEFTEYWNGLDDNGLPLPEGDYVAKAIYMPASIWHMDSQYHTFNAKYVMAAGDSWQPENETQLPWIFGHSGGNVQDVQAGPNGIAGFLPWYLEGSWNPFKVDLNQPIGYDQVVQTYESWYTAGGSTIATDGQVLFAYNNVYGNHAIYRPDRAGDRHHWGPDDMANGSIPGITVNCKKMDADVPSMAAWRDGTNNIFLYVAQRDDAESSNDKIIIIDGDNDSAAVLAESTLNTPQAISLDPSALGTRLYAMHQDAGGAWVVSSIGLTNGVFSGGWQLEFAVPTSIANPEDMEVDSNGIFWITDMTADLVYRVDPAGPTATTIGDGTAPTDGAFDTGEFRSPRRLSVWKDTSGVEHLLVVETEGAGRISQWSVDATPAYERQWFLSQTTGSNGFVADEAQPDHMYNVGASGNYLIRYAMDYAAGTWDVDAMWELPYGGDHRLTIVNHANGQKYAAFGGGSTSTTAVYRIDGYTLAPAAADIEGQWWHDANGDGLVQAGEKTGATAFPANQYWAQPIIDDLSILTWDNGTYYRLAPTFDALNNPIYDGANWQPLLQDPVRQDWLADPENGPSDPLYGGNEENVWFDGDWIDIDGSDADGFFVSDSFGPPNPYGAPGSYNEQHVMAKLAYYAPDGMGGFEPVWRVGQRAGGAGTAQPGEMYIPYRITGPTDGLIGTYDMFAGVYHIYTDEGLYVDTIGMDAYRENISLLVQTRNSNSGAYFISDGVYQSEHFVDSTTGKAYWLVGRGSLGVYEIEGWDANAVLDLPITSAGQIVQLTAPDPDAYENGSDPAVFNVHRVGSVTDPLTVHYSIGGSATNGIDYTALTGSVTIPAGLRDAEIVIDPVDDPDEETPENIILTLTVDAAYTIEPGAGERTATLHDNDLVVTITASDPNAAEFSANGTTFFFNRFEEEDTSEVWAGRATVLTGPYSPSGGMTRPTWSTGNIGSVAGSAVVPPTFGNYFFEDDSTGFDTQSLSVFTHAQGDGYGWIGHTAVNGSGLSGTDAGQWEFGFDISLTGRALGLDTTVWSYQGGMLLNGTDGLLAFFTYDDGDVKVQHAGGWATIVDGFETIRPYSIEAVVDMSADTFTVLVDGQQVGGPYGVVNPGSGTITGYEARGGHSNGPEGHMAFYDDIYLQTPGDAWRDQGEFTVSRTGSALGDLEVHYTVSGTATPGYDFLEPLEGSVIIPDGQHTATITITPVNDTLAEHAAGETITLDLVQAGYTVGTPSGATVTIAEDDKPTINIDAVDDQAGEVLLDVRTIFLNQFETENPFTNDFHRVWVNTGPYLADGVMTLPTFTNSLGPWFAASGVAAYDHGYYHREPGDPGVGTGFPTNSLSIFSHWYGDFLDHTGRTGIRGAGLTGTETGQYRFSFDTTLSSKSQGTDTTTWTELPGLTIESNNANHDPLLRILPSDGDLLLQHPGGFTTIIDNVPIYEIQHLDVYLDMDTDTYSVFVNDSQIGGAYDMLVTGTAISGYEVEGGEGGNWIMWMQDNIELAAQPMPNRGVFQVTRDGNAGDLTVYYVVSGSADENDFIETLTGSIVIPDGKYSAEIRITPQDEGVYEGDEELTLTIIDDSSYLLGDSPADTVTILDHRQTIELQTPDGSAAEAGANPAQFIISRDDTYGNLRVYYEFTGSADAADFVEPLTGSVIIPSGQSSAPINLTPIDDGEYEQTETLTLTLSTDTGYILGETISGNATLADNDVLEVWIEPIDAFASEDQAAATTFFYNNFEAEAPPESGRVQPLTEAYNPAGGMTRPTWTSWRGDYLAAGVVHPTYGGYYPDSHTGFTTPALSVYSHWLGDWEGHMGRAQLRGDGFAGTETGTYVFSYDLSITTHGLNTDTDGWETPPGIALEAAGSFGQLFNIRTDEGNLVVDHADGTSVLLEDVTILSPYHIDVILDMDADTFFVTLDGQPVGGVFNQTTPTPDVKISGYEARGGKGADGHLTFYDNISLSSYAYDHALVRISRNSNLGETAVNYTTSGSVDAADINETLTGSAVIPAGSRDAVIVLTPVADGQPEGVEDLILSLATGAGYTVVSPSQATVTIADHRQSVSIEAIDSAAGEAGSDTGQFIISRTESTGDLWVSYQIGGSASAGDYAETLTGSALIPDGQLSVPLTITPVDDGELEGAEAVVLNLLPGSDYVPASGSATVSIADDEGPADVARWRLNGSPFDDGAGGHNLVVASGEYASVGREGGASLLLDGVDDYAISTGDMADLFSDETITVSLWFKATDAGVILGELGQSQINTGWQTSFIELMPSGLLKMRVWGTNDISLGSVGFGDWHHAALRYDKSNSTLTGFLDGRPGMTTITGDRYTSGEAGLETYFALGASNGGHLGNGTYFGGAIDDVRIFASALSDADIEALYEQFAPRVSLSTPDPVAAETGPDAATVVVSRTGDNSDTLTIYYRLNGTADAGDVVELLTGSVTIPAGQASTTLTLTPIDDALLEGTETLTLELYDPNQGSYVYDDFQTGWGTTPPNVNNLNGERWIVIDDNWQWDGWSANSNRLGESATGRMMSAPIAVEPGQVLKFAVDGFSGLGGEPSIITMYEPVVNAFRVRANSPDGPVIAEVVPNGGGVRDVFVDPRGAETIYLEAVDDSTDTGWAWLRLDNVRILGSADAVVEPATAPYGSFEQGLLGWTILSGDAWTPVRSTWATRAPYEGGVYLTSNAPVLNGYTTGAVRSPAIQVTDDTLTAALAGHYGENYFRLVDENFMEIPGSRVAAPSRSHWEDYTWDLESLGVYPGDTIYLEAHDTLDTAEGAWLAIDWIRHGDMTPRPSYIIDAPSEVTVTIADNDAADPVVSIVALDADAGEAGYNPGAFRISRSGSTAGDLTVNYAISGSASAGDYAEALTGSIVIPDGQSSAVLSVTPSADGEIENTENLTLTLQSGAGFTLGSASAATVDIADADKPEVSIEAITPVTAEQGGPTGQFLITRSGAGLLTQGDLTVEYTLSGFASSGDYAETFSGTATIANDQSSVLLTVTPVDDAEVEGDEQLVLTLKSDTAYNLADTDTAAVTITDDELDLAKGLSYEYYEGSWSVLPNFDTMTPVATGLVDGFDISPRLKSDFFGFRFTGHLYAPQAGEYTFYTTSDDGSRLYIDDTMVVDNDGGHGMQERSGTITLSAGYHPITVTYFEGNYGEGLVVEWAGPGIAREVLGRDSLFRPSVASPTVTITADDAYAFEAGQDKGRFVISRDGTAGDLTVHYTVAGKADATDYVETFTGSVMIPDGAASAPLDVTPVDDPHAEGAEDLRLTLVGDLGYHIGDQDTASVGIADNDLAPAAPVHHWLFNGDLTDAAGAADGTMFNGTPAYDAGSRDDALWFDGVNDWVQMPDVSLPGDGTAWTVAWWMNPNTARSWNQAFGAANGWGEAFLFHCDHNGGVYVGCNGDQRFTPSDLPAGTVETGKWQHFAFTFDNGTTRFYKNGEVLATKTGCRVPTSWGGWRLGQGDGNTIDGLLDDMRIYDQTLSSEHIADLAFSHDKPTVALTVDDSQAAEEGPDTATVTFSRTNPLSGDVTIHYSLGGTAHADDVEPLTGEVMIPYGQTSVTLTVTPVDDENAEPTETLTLTIQDHDSYAMGAAVTGDIAIADNDSLLAGDADIDGDVDLTDLAILAGHWGMTEGASWPDGDFDGDGDVDLTDLAILASNWGAGANQAGATSTPPAATTETLITEGPTNDLDETVSALDLAIPAAPSPNMATFAPPSTEPVAFASANGWVSLKQAEAPQPSAKLDEDPLDLLAGPALRIDPRAV